MLPLLLKSLHSYLNVKCVIDGFWKPKLQMFFMNYSAVLDSFRK